MRHRHDKTFFLVSLYTSVVIAWGAHGGGHGHTKKRDGLWISLSLNNSPLQCQKSTERFFMHVLAIFLALIKIESDPFIQEGGFIE